MKHQLLAIFALALRACGWVFDNKAGAEQGPPWFLYLKGPTQRGHTPQATESKDSIFFGSQR